MAKKPTQAIGEEKETFAVELRGEEELEVKMIPDIKVREYEKLESQPQGVFTQEPTTLEIFVEASTQLKVSEPEVEIVSNLNLVFFIMIPEQYQDT